VKFTAVVAYLLFVITPILGAPLQFGASITDTSYINSFAMQQQAFDDFAQVLSDQMKRNVKVTIFRSSDQLLKGLDEGTIDFAYLDLMSYAAAQTQHLNIHKLLTTLTRIPFTPNKSVTSSSCFIARMEKGNIATYVDLQGSRIGFIRNSATGFVFPVHFLLLHGIDYRSYFREIHFYDTHAALYSELMGDQIDAAATSEADFLRNQASQNLKLVTIIPGIPNPMIATSGKLSSTDAKQIKDTLLKLPEEAYDSLPFVGMQETDADFYKEAVKIIQNRLSAEQ
jgi:ABC-type phosphate/phosphonate transport system substrate-binding protein